MKAHRVGGLHATDTVTWQLAVLAVYGASHESEHAAPLLQRLAVPSYEYSLSRRSSLTIRHADSLLPPPFDELVTRRFPHNVILRVGYSPPYSSLHAYFTIHNKIPCGSIDRVAG